MKSMTLLTDEQMSAFVRDGYVQLQTDFPAAFHRHIYERIEGVIEKSDNPGNNLLPRIPEIQEVFDHPVVRGALSGILGPSFYLHPHRYCHYNPPRSEGQGLHKDSWAKRRHRTRWAMALYYPQDTTQEMGPTGVVPGSQYFNAGPYHGREAPLTGPAGSVVLVHYDLWHRATPNTSDKKRFMVKFLFTRLDEPEVPAWSGGRAWLGAGGPLDGLWHSVWNWYTGHPAVPPRVGESAQTLLAELASGDEAVRFRAAYGLAALGEGSVSRLADLICSENAALRRDVSYAFCAIGPPAAAALADIARSSVPAPVRASALETLGDIGEPAGAAVPVLAEALGDAAPQVRQAAAEALGTMAGAATPALGRLAAGLRDEDEWVNRNAALALLRLGRRTQPVAGELCAALRHPNRYVRFKAAKALERIGTPETLEAACDFYRTNAWCISTDQGSAF